MLKDLIELRKELKTIKNRLHIKRLGTHKEIPKLVIDVKLQDITLFLDRIEKIIKKGES